MKASKQVALFAEGFEHKHYEGATKEYEILDELEGHGKGFFIKVFFINDQVNLNKWQVTWDGIKQDIADVVGVPIVKQDDLRHPNFAIQNLYAKGYIVDYVLNEEKHEAYVIARILDAETIRLIREGDLQFVSPAVVARNNLTLETLDSGVDLLSRFIALHLALVREPAYGKVNAKIHGTCSGSGQACGAKLKQMSAEVLHELDSVNDDCVSNKISILKDEHPDWDQDKIIAVAISMCENKTAENIPGSDAQDMAPLTQTKLVRKLTASVNRLNSEVNQIERHAAKAEHEGHWGYWLRARDVDVFVADGVTIDAAILSQCGCPKEAAEDKKINKKQLDIGTKIEMEHTDNEDVAKEIALDHLREDPAYYIKLITLVEPENIDMLLAAKKATKKEADYQRTASTSINCHTCKFFNPDSETCDKVEGQIGEYFISKFWERKTNFN